MACLHKSDNDLQLQYVDWKVKTLFIGTFNPSWPECENNYSEWFYGSTNRNEFWCILPTVHGHHSLLNGNREVWINFCRKHHLAMTDILASIDNANVDNLDHRNAICKFKDDAIADFEVTVNDIPELLRQHTDIKQICITRQTLPDFWEDCFIAMFQFIETHPERGIEIKLLRSPSRGARRGVVGNFCEYIGNKWLQQGYLIDP